MFKRTIVLCSSLAFVFVSSISFAADEPTRISSEGRTYKQTSPTSMESVHAVEAQAKVIGVDHKKRTLKLQTQDGEQVTLHVNEDVRNFKEIKKGDMLRVGYINSLAWEIKKNSEEPVTITQDSDITRAAPGAKPGGVLTDKITARGVVTKVDKKKQTVTVQGPYRTIVMDVPKPEVFNNIKVGDKLEATYTEAIAISIESVKK
jgi:hypothetical protein